MSVFHRVDDLEGMEARRFVAFALRLPAYRGAVLACYEHEQEDTQQPQDGPGASGGGVFESAASMTARQVHPSRAAISMDPVLGSLVSTATAEGGN